MSRALEQLGDVTTGLGLNGCSRQLAPLPGEGGFRIDFVCFPPLVDLCLLELVHGLDEAASHEHLQLGTREGLLCHGGGGDHHFLLYDFFDFLLHFDGHHFLDDRRSGRSAGRGDQTGATQGHIAHELATREFAVLHCFSSLSFV